MKFLKSIDWLSTILISLTIASISLVVYFIWDIYHWRTLPDGRSYRLNHTCISSHIETYPILHTQTSPDGNIFTYTSIETSEICDAEIVDTVWRK